MDSAKTHPVDGMTNIDFNSPDFQENFKEIYAGIHASGCPFAHSSRGDHYAIASHEALTKALLQPKLWRSKFGPGLPYQPEDVPGVLVTVDPPEHTFEAKIAGRAFTRDYFDSFEPRIQAFLDERLDAIYERGCADLHKEISEPLPLFVIFEMFGIPVEGRAERFRAELKTRVGFMLKPADMRGGMRTSEFSEETYAMLRDQMELSKERLASGAWAPGENLFTRFLTTEVDGKRLSDEKIIGFGAFLLTAGSATTTILLSNLLHRLLSALDQFEKVRANPALVTRAIEEALRIDAPVQGLFRTNDEEVDLGPAHLERDTKVMMLWAAANLDPTVFRNPLTFDVERDPAELRKHVAFGHGIHICRGAPLARMEAKLFLETLIRRLPNMRIAGEVKLELSMPVLQGIAELPIAWDVR